MIVALEAAWLAVKTFVRAHPGVVKFVVGAGLVAVAWWQFTNWRDDLIKTADAAGFARAEAQYVEAVSRANERELRLQNQLDHMVLTYGALASEREQFVTLTLKPTIERIESEVAADPHYRECAVGDGVLDDLNAGRATVDRSIAASNPSADRPGS